MFLVSSFELPLIDSFKAETFHSASLIGDLFQKNNDVVFLLRIGLEIYSMEVEIPCSILTAGLTKVRLSEVL